MTYVTCPIKRYHPAVVAQMAATVAVLADDRFTLGLGAGENLNEHVTGGGWPPVNVRHQMLAEAVDITRSLWAGGYVSVDGRHFQVDSAKLWDLPERPLRLGIAASGEQSDRLAGQKADCLIAVEPLSAVVAAFDTAGGTGKPRVGQLPISYDVKRDAAIKRALELFGWFGGGSKVNSELPGPAAFEAASRFVRADDIVDAIPCGDSVDAGGQRGQTVRRRRFQPRRPVPGRRGPPRRVYGVVADAELGSPRMLRRRKAMPQSAWSAKRERQYEHIEQGLEERGRPPKVAKEIASRTVNKERARAGEARQASRTSTDDISSGRRGGLRSHRGSGGRTRDRLCQEARRRNIKGRSKMSKGQLESALGGR